MELPLYKKEQILGVGCGEGIAKIKKLFSHSVWNSIRHVVRSFSVQLVIWIWNPEERNGLKIQTGESQYIVFKGMGLGFSTFLLHPARDCKADGCWWWMQATPWSSSLLSSARPTMEATYPSVLHCVVFYHTVAFHKCPRDGCFVEQLDSYYPLPNSHGKRIIALNPGQIWHWIACGAHLCKPVE